MISKFPYKLWWIFDQLIIQPHYLLNCHQGSRKIAFLFVVIVTNAKKNDVSKVKKGGFCHSFSPSQSRKVILITNRKWSCLSFSYFAFTCRRPMLWSATLAIIPKTPVRRICRRKLAKATNTAQNSTSVCK